jgi:hypothetical protein
MFRAPRLSVKQDVCRARRSRDVTRTADVPRAIAPATADRPLHHGVRRGGRELGSVELRGDGVRKEARAEDYRTCANPAPGTIGDGPRQGFAPTSHRRGGGLSRRSGLDWQCEGERRRRLAEVEDVVTEAVVFPDQHAIEAPPAHVGHQCVESWTSFGSQCQSDWPSGWFEGHSGLVRAVNPCTSGAPLRGCGA